MDMGDLERCLQAATEAGARIKVRAGARLPPAREPSAAGCPGPLLR
jgi:hypothetical protein